MRTTVFPGKLTLIFLFTYMLFEGITPGQTNMSRSHIVCDAPLFDFGTKSNSVEVDHEFLIRNAGNMPLVIAQVRSGCGCTQATLTQNTIPPGSNAVLSARLTLKGIVGPKRTHIYLHTNDPANPVFQFQLSGSAVVGSSVTPPK